MIKSYESCTFIEVLFISTDIIYVSSQPSQKTFINQVWGVGKWHGRKYSLLQMAVLRPWCDFKRTHL